MLVPLKLNHPSLCFKPTVHPKCSMYPNSCIFHHVFYFSKHLLACVKCIHSEFKTFPPRICTFLLFYTRQKYNQNVTKAIESPVDKKKKQKSPPGCTQGWGQWNSIWNCQLWDFSKNKWKAYIKHAFQGLWTHSGLCSLKRSTAAFKIHPAHL